MNLSVASLVLQPVGRQELDELKAGRLEPRHLCEARHVLVLVLSEKQNKLPRRGAESCVPSTQRSARNDGCVVGRSSFGAGDRPGHGRPPSPKVARDERREDAPRGGAIACRADVSNDVDPGYPSGFDDKALRMVVQMQSDPVASRT